LTRSGLRPRVIVATGESQSAFYLLDFGPATQADSRGFRLWEAAGDAHADECLGSLCATDEGNLAGAGARFNAMLNPPTTLVGITCGKPVNTGEQGYSVAAGLEELIGQAAAEGALPDPPRLRARLGRRCGPPGLPAGTLPGRRHPAGPRRGQVDGFLTQARRTAPGR
jgi:hypothetical protein